MPFSNGLPLGIQILAGRGEDSSLIDAATKLEQVIRAD